MVADEIFSAKRILGVEPLSLQGERLLLVLHEDDSEQSLSLLRERGRTWTELKRLQLPHQALALDAQLVEGELLVATEVNRGWPLRVFRCRRDELLDPSQSPLALKSVAEVELSAEQAQRVNLPGGRLWNVPDVLDPSSWLFSPRFVPGEAPGVMIVNTADGQAMLVAAVGLSGEAKGFAHPGAFSPQAIVQATSGRLLAFMRMEENARYPFWSLSRYHPGLLSRAGALTVVEENGPEQDLSASLGFGPVLDFQLVLDRGQPWLFALKDAPVGTQVLALQRGADGWKVLGSLELDPEAQMLAVAPGGREWALFLVEQSQTGAVIHHRLWEPR
jgi:hypothetical protein